MEFCHILNKLAAQLHECLSFKDFGLRQNSRASFRRKLGESAICSKYEQNSTASLSVAYLFFIIYLKSIEWTIHKIGKFKVVCMFYCIGIYNKHCLSLPKLKNDNTQHTHPLKFFNLIIVHTLDFWYMIKNK